VIWRVTKRQTFIDLKRKGKRVRHGSVSMIYFPLETKYPQVAFSLTRKFGGAVKRNRARRRLKSAFLNAFEGHSDLSGAYLISASPRVTDISFSKVVSELDSCFSKITEEK